MACTSTTRRTISNTIAKPERRSVRSALARHDRHRRCNSTELLDPRRSGELLPRLFDRILIPPAVFEELQHPETPDVVRRWIAGPPSWLRIRAMRSVLDPALGFLDAGEREAIALAEELHADQLLLDDADARREAARRNLPFIGTLGVLREAARRELVDLRVVLVQLQETSFFVDPALIESLLDEEARRKQRS